MKKINKQTLCNIVRESIQGLMNEGAGAGYDVTFEGLEATDVKLTGTEVRRNLNSTDKIVKFTAKLAPSVVEWKAIGYYEGVTSKGIYYNDDLVEEFDELEKTVNGGNISGWVYYEDVNNSAPTWETEQPSEEDVVQFISDYLTDFSFTTMYGAGWVHANLSDPMVFENIEIQDKYKITYVYIDTIEISAPEITKAINWYFENSYRFDEIFGEEETEETPEQKPLQEKKQITNKNMKKQAIKLKESQLRDIIKESVKKVLGENWQNSADEWALSHIENLYDPNGAGNDIDSLDKEARFYQKFKQEFEQEFGIGSLEKAQEVAHRFERFGINPSNFLFKHFTAPATQAYDNWNIRRN